MNKKLHRLASEFYKISGVLEVPHELLKKVEDWVVGRYSWYAARALEEKIEDMKMRVQMHKALHKLYAKIYDAFFAIEGMVLEKDGSFNEFVNLNFPISIPYFSLDDFDIHTDQRGVVDTIKESSLLIDVVEIKEGVYNFKLKIGSGYDEVSSVNIKHTKIHEKEMRKILRDHFKDIQKIIFMYWDFIEKFSYSKPEELRALYIRLAIIKKLQVEGGDHKVFKVRASELPYFSSLNLPIDKISFNAHIVTDEAEREKKYSEPWIGLWSPSNINVGSGMYRDDVLPLGTISIYIDVDKNQKEILNLKHINFSIYQIKGTVRHELQHMIQSSIKHLKGLGDLGGIPGRKIRDKGVDIDGNPVGSSERLSHGLRDVEFYTRLTDAIHEFNNFKKIIPLKYHQKFAKAFVGLEDKNLLIDELSIHPEKDRFKFTMPTLRHYLDKNQGTEFFSSLMSESILKFKKAVKEFMKAVL